MLYVTAASFHTERRHGSTRVPGHAFPALRSLLRMVVYIYYITAAGNSISCQLGSSCQNNRYGRKKQAVWPYRDLAAGVYQSL
jgi:hypothetical protein